MDECDIGKARAEELEAEALAAWKKRRSAPEGPGRRTCKECGEPIPEARRRAIKGVTRCVDCQRAAEREGL